LANTTLRSAFAVLPSQEKREIASTNWLIYFVVLHLVFQLILIVPALLSLRLFLRLGAFGISLVFVLFIPKREQTRLPVSNWAVAIFMLLTLECLHPDSTSLIAAAVQFALYPAILGPVFWVPRSTVTVRSFQSLIVLLWLYYSAGALLGVLQSYFPGTFQPQVATIIADMGKDYVASLQIQLSSGEHIFRPMGLTNVPGGAAYAGLYAILLGTGVLLSPKPPFFGARLTAIGTMVLGLMCLYLCQVRSILVMVGICMIVLLGLLAVSGRGTRLVGLLASIAAVIPVATLASLSLAGRAVTERLGTLVKTDAGTVYHQSRGRFLEDTLTYYLPEYPLGAGLGRWGMVCHYFKPIVTKLWVEIQWTGWLFDGGVPLIVLYFGAILVTTWSCLRVARGQAGGRDPSLSVWGAVLVSYNVGAIALCFNYTPFIGTAGLEFWLLNATLVCAAIHTDRNVVALGA